MLRFSIIGGADPARNDPERADTYRPPVPIPETQEIARLVGRELAKRGHGLVVYDAGFIEADVVEGFVGAQPPETRDALILVPSRRARRCSLRRRSWPEPPAQRSGWCSSVATAAARSSRPRSASRFRWA